MEPGMCARSVRLHEVVNTRGKVALKFVDSGCDVDRDHFKRTLRSLKWHVVRGWHIFRHSSCSDCAAVGVDQRAINRGLEIRPRKWSIAIVT